jgi:hypothetical protein
MTFQMLEAPLSMPPFSGEGTVTCTPFWEPYIYTHHQGDTASTP